MYDFVSTQYVPQSPHSWRKYVPIVSNVSQYACPDSSAERRSGSVTDTHIRCHHQELVRFRVVAVAISTRATQRKRHKIFIWITGFAERAHRTMKSTLPSCTFCKASQYKQYKLRKSPYLSVPLHSNQYIHVQ